MSTARSDYVAHIRSVLVLRQTASPTLLRKIYNSRPGAFPETPCVYIGPRDETIAITAQTTTREFQGLSAVVVDNLADASETGDRMDDLIDLLFGDFTTHRNVAGGGGQLWLSSVTDTDVVLTGPNGTATYRGAILGFRNSSIQEGLGASA